METKARKTRVAKIKGRREEERMEETERERGKKKEKMMEVKRVAEELKIWDEEEEAAESEVEAKKLVLERFHKWIYVFGKKASEWMPTRKLWNHTIETKKGFVLRKEKMYLLSRKEREEVCKFILEQLRKGYIRPSKLPQMAPVFFVGKKNRKKRMVQDYRYLNKWTI